MVSNQSWKLFAIVLSAMLALAVIPVAMAQDAGTINVRSADHPGFSRIVFDFSRDLPFQTAIAGQTLTVRFGGIFEPAIDRVANQGLVFAKSPEVSHTANETIVVFAVPDGVQIRSFKDGTRVVVDIMGAGPQQVIPTEAAPTQTQITEYSDPEKVTLPPVTAETPKRSIETKKNTILPEQGGDFRIAVQEQPDGLTLVYPWQRPVSAAVFIRSGTLWVIFDHPSEARHDGFSEPAAARLSNWQQLPDRRASIFRYRIDPRQQVSASLSGTVWTVHVSEQTGPLADPIHTARQITGTRNKRIFLATEKIGGAYTLIDPDIGDELDVFPVGGSVRGVANVQSFPEFRILASAQGIVIRKISDSIIAEANLTGVTIDSSAGLVLSETTVAARVSEALGQEDMGPERLIDFEKWAHGGPENFRENSKELLYRLSMANADKRNAERWDLARFYMAHGLASDGLAVLTLMVEEDDALLENPQFLAVRGVAYHMLGRPEEAMKDLSHPDLDAEPDAYLWRSLVAESNGQYEMAQANFRQGISALLTYEPKDRVDFQLAAARAGLALEDIDFIHSQLAIVELYPMTESQTAEAKYLRARMYEDLGDKEGARVAYTVVASLSNRMAAAEARLASLEMGMADGQIDKDEAINQLERLRFAWRGDNFELKLLTMLGDLYLEKGEYRLGLEALRQAVTHFPKDGITKDLVNRMGRVFKTLFIDGKAEQMFPVAAVALYFDFQELTPLGSEGDQMIRRLADRLVEVDLLARGAELLDHQVRFRLEGAAQAQIAARLAKIYLLDGKPDQALEIIRATRQDRLPEEIALTRRLVEARTLIELERFEEADILIEEDRIREADILRADIEWTAQNWPGVIRTTNKLLAEKPGQGNDVELDEEDRRFILRQAIALALLDDRPMLAQIHDRYSKLMAGGNLANAFDLITSEDISSGGEVSVIASNIAGVDSLQSFMAAYRAEFVSADMVSQQN